MKTNCLFFIVLALTIFLSPIVSAEVLPREQWGAPEVTVSYKDGKWIIAGKKHKVILNASDLAMKVEAGPVNWAMAPSQKDDMLVKSKGEEFYLRLADAGRMDITPYDTGYKTGLKIRLEQFRSRGLLTKGLELDLALVLTVCLEGRAEELVCEAAAIEREARVRQLDWPKELNGSDVNYTALSHGRGNLLPRDWPEVYQPYRNAPRGTGLQAGTDTSVVQSNLIECWSMSWWGFQKKDSAMILIMETSDDASYKFDHPAGGLTVIGPRWLASLGKLGYPRSVRMCFFSKGNYVDMCKRYRQYVIDTGQFVSLKEKIAKEPLVAKLIGTPQVRQHTLKNYKPGGFRYDAKNPETKL
jgi:hypothetical protein